MARLKRDSRNIVPFREGATVSLLLIDRTVMYTSALVYGAIGSRTTAKGNSIGNSHGTLLLLNLY